MKHLLIDADSIAYTGAYKEDELLGLRRVDDFMKQVWDDCWLYARENGHDMQTRTTYVETWEQKYNFRRWVACTLPYKGGRAKSIPKHYIDLCKKHMVDKYGAITVVYEESEDRCLQDQRSYGAENCIVAYKDKDVPQAAGIYYNYDKREFLTLTHEEAELRLWKQVLTGDKSTDNIPGLDGIGPKRAETALDGVPVECYSNHVAHIYKELGHSYGYFIEQCRLIYLLREPAEVWLPITSEEWSEL